MECSVAGTTTLDREWSPKYILQDFWVPVMPTCYPNTGLILQKIFGRKLVSRESIGKLMMGATQNESQIWFIFIFVTKQLNNQI
jgi:hypothetical protein